MDALEYRNVAMALEFVAGAVEVQDAAVHIAFVVAEFLHASGNLDRAEHYASHELDLVVDLELNLVLLVLDHYPVDHLVDFEQSDVVVHELVQQDELDNVLRMLQTPAYDEQEVPE